MHELLAVPSPSHTLVHLSFIHHHSSTTEEEPEDDEDEDEEKPKIKLTIEEDYDIGHAIRTAIIPESVFWFTGEAADDDDEGMDYEGMGEDDDDEDDDDDEEGGGGGRVVSTPGGGFASAPGATGAPGETQPECKQN